jgi:hypothetical protein
MMEERMAEQNKKMEDSNGYLKKMYEDRIKNNEEVIVQLRRQVDEQNSHIGILKTTVAKG